MKIHLLCVLFFLHSVTLHAQAPTEEETIFNLYGFVRANLFWDDQDLGRTDLFVPANIKVDAAKNPNTFIGAKQTRFGLDVKHNLASHALIIKIEGDFHNDASNATGLFRMRHASLAYRFAIAGMTWSNFFDEEVNPVTIDFEGPNSSTLSRTPQVRLLTNATKNVFSISFENPIQHLTVGGATKALPERYPDIIGAYRFNGKFGFIKTAILFRELRYESDRPRSLLGYGGTLMALIKTGARDKLKFQVVMGTGVAKYIQGAVSLNYDAIYNGTDELDALQMRGANISYQHFWKDHLHSSFTAGFLNVEENDHLGENDYQHGYYGALNLFLDVLKHLTLGVEGTYGERINVSTERGNAVRVQMSVTYKFNKTLK